MSRQNREFNNVPVLFMNREAPEYPGKVYRAGPDNKLFLRDGEKDALLTTPDNQKSQKRRDAERENLCTNCCNNMTLRDLLLCTFIWRSFGCDTGDCDCAPEHCCPKMDCTSCNCCV